MSDKEIYVDMIEVKLISVQGHAAVVSYRDYDGIVRARVISLKAVAGLRIGESSVIPLNIVKTGTEYGIDWETLLGEEYAITPVDIGQELRRHGLWTYDDLNSNPNEVTAALNSLSHRVHVELLRAAREIK